MLLTVTCAELFQRAQLARPDTHLTITFVKVSSIMLCVVMVVVEFEDILPEVGVVSSVLVAVVIVVVVIVVVLVVIVVLVVVEER